MREKLIKKLRRDGRRLLRENWIPGFDLICEQRLTTRIRLALRLVLGRKIYRAEGAKYGLA